MAQNSHSPAGHHATDDHGDAQKKRIWKTFWYLLIITVIELGLGLFIYAVEMASIWVLLVKGLIVIFALLKAFYIVAIFMHLGDEIRNLVLTIVVPLSIFIWFITAFLWDGNAFRNMRNKYDPHFFETTMQGPVRAADTSGRQMQ